MAYITIVKGDDTDFMDNQYLVVNFNTDINLAGFKAVFEIDNIELLYPDLSAKYIEIILSNEVTSKLKQGKMYGTLKIIDTESRIRTVTTVIPFNVVTKVANTSQISEQSIQLDVKVYQNEFNVDMSIVGLSKTVAEGYLNKMKQSDETVTNKLNSILELNDDIKQKAAETYDNASLAKQWATSGVLVNGEDYSAKYYAEQAQFFNDQAQEAISTLATRADVDLSNITEDAKKVIKENSGSDFNLFDTKITDHILQDEEAVGWLLQGSLVTMVYPDAVNKIKELYEGGSDTTYRGIACKKSTDGRYIADIGVKDSVDSLFDTTGVADFYILDSVNNQFYLPRSKWFHQFTLDTSLVNQYNEVGLPNITGEVQRLVFTSDQEAEEGALYAEYLKTQGISASAVYGNLKQLGFDASRSNPIYGSSDTVQPPSSNKLLYYKVGDVVKNVTSIDVAEVLNELQMKANATDIDGQWVGLSTRVTLVNASFTAEEIKSCDLSNYLPNDGSIYEILIGVDTKTSTTSGDTAYCNVFTSVIPSVVYVSGCRTVTASQSISTSSVIIPIGTDRILNIQNGSVEDTGTIAVYLNGYRKVR